MATTVISAPLIGISTNRLRIVAGPSQTLPSQNLHLRTHDVLNSSGHFMVEKKNRPLLRIVRSVEETLIIPDEPQEAQEEEAPSSSEQPAVSVPVSPSDTLTMFFQAEGTMNEAAIPTVIKALEGTQGITDLKVQVVEGIASVELTKQTTVQATGVASSLVEAIQGSGFKLQTLNLSFGDEEISLG